MEGLKHGEGERDRLGGHGRGDVPAVSYGSQQQSQEEVANVAEQVIECRDGEGVAELQWVAAQCVVVAHVLITTDIQELQGPWDR